jgi:hypothetical protein
LAKLPATAGDVCRFAEALVRDWLPDVGNAIDAVWTDEFNPPAGYSLPDALHWAYRAFGLTGDLLFRQDPLVPLADLTADPNGIVTFRREQQGCAFWGFPAHREAAGNAPPVLIRWPDETEWRPFQDRLSTHVFEGVLSEAMLDEASVTANLEATDEALLALEGLEPIDIPAHPMWTAPDAGSVRWFGLPDAVVRNDGDTWLWALARTPSDRERLMAAIPGDWHDLDF